MSSPGFRAIALLSTVFVVGCSDDTAAPAPDAPAGESKGPGATLQCTSSGKNAWDTYGADAFVAVNKKIFALVGDEITANGTANLGDSFTKVGTGAPGSSTGDNAAIFEGKLAAFLVWAYGGPAEITYTDGGRYRGPQNMTAAHVGLAITSDQYDYFLTNNVVPALTQSGVPASDVSSCFAPILGGDFKASIVGK